MLSKNYEESVNDCELCYAKIKDLETIVDELKVEAQNVKVDKCSLDKVKGEYQKKVKLIEDFKVEKDKLESDLEFAEKKWKELNKLLKTGIKSCMMLKRKLRELLRILLKLKMS